MALRRIAPLFLLTLLLAVPASAQAEGRVASAIGVKQLNGEKLFVDVVVAVPSGQGARKATDKALSQQGARRVKPPSSEEFFYTGLEWSPPSVVQHYNPRKEPPGLNGTAKTHLMNTHSTWSQPSAYEITDGLNTDSCPSLVNKCKGRQKGDGSNDVGWLPLGGSTLGVTSFRTSVPEADMALNPRFTWKDTCNNSGSGFDVETVFLHENGHVAGLDHVTRTDSVMSPSYQGARCTLFPYDEAALANLYP